MQDSSQRLSGTARCNLIVRVSGGACLVRRQIIYVLRAVKARNLRGDCPIHIFNAWSPCGALNCLFASENCSAPAWFVSTKRKKKINRVLPVRFQKIADALSFIKFGRRPFCLWLSSWRASDCKPYRSVSIASSFLKTAMSSCTCVVASVKETLQSNRTYLTYCYIKFYIWIAISYWLILKEEPYPTFKEPAKIC